MEISVLKQKNRDFYTPSLKTLCLKILFGVAVGDFFSVLGLALFFLQINLFYELQAKNHDLEQNKKRPTQF